MATPTYTHWIEANDWEGETWSVLINEQACPLTAANLQRITTDPKTQEVTGPYKAQGGLTREEAEAVERRYGTRRGYLPATQWLEEPAGSLLEKPWERLPQDIEELENVLYKISWYWPL